MINNSSFSGDFQGKIEIDCNEIWSDPDLVCPDNESNAGEKPIIDPATEIDVANAIISNPIVSTAICGIFDPSLISEKKIRTIVKIVLDHVLVYNCNPTFEQIKTQINKIAKDNEQMEKEVFDYYTIAKMAIDHPDKFNTSEYYIDQAKQLAAKRLFLKTVHDALKFSKPLNEVFEKAIAGIAKAQKINATQKWKFRDYSLIKAIAETQTDDFLIENWLEFQTLGMLTGDPFSGKSCIVTKIINAICKTGRFGGKKVQQDCGILILDQENKERTTVSRFLSECGGDDSSIKFLQADLPVRLGKLDALQVNDCIKAAKEELQCEKIFVVIDTMRSVLKVDEMETNSVTDCLYPLKTAAVETNAAILVLHHRPKSGAKFSGSTAITGALDYHWLWDADKDTMIATLKLEGERSGATEAPMRFQYSNGKNEFLDSGFTPKETDSLTQALDSAFRNKESLSQTELIKLIQHYYKEYDGVNCPGNHKLRAIIKQYQSEGVLFLDDSGRIRRTANLMPDFDHEE